jgi:hypothetical protein
MPYMTNGKRDYSKELAWEKKNGKKRQTDRVKRNAARSMMEQEGIFKKGDVKQVDHKKTLKNGGSNDRSNLRVVSAKTNATKEAMRKKRNG